MRVLARVNLALPWHGAGAEVYLHSLLRELARRGHEPIVLARGAPRDALLDGIHVHRLDEAREATWPHTFNPDVVLTHLDDTRAAQRGAAAIGAPLVALLHNHRQLAIGGHAHDGVTRLAVFNSEWTRDATRPVWRGASVVLRPPVDPDDYAVSPLVKRELERRQVALVNLQPEKGASLFYELAARRPDLEFVGVVGGYGQQLRRGGLPNVRILDHLAHDRMRDDVYARCMVLLMPSDYESFGRCAVEAAWAGVPTVAHPTGGLVEALGLDGAGVFAHRDRPDEWERVLGCLLGFPGEARSEWRPRYDAHRAAALERASVMRPDYDPVVRAIEEVAG